MSGLVVATDLYACNLSLCPPLILASSTAETLAKSVDRVLCRCANPHARQGGPRRVRRIFERPTVPHFPRNVDVGSSGAVLASDGFLFGPAGRGCSSVPEARVRMADDCGGQLQSCASPRAP